VVQRELISADVSRAGLRTIAWLVVAMVAVASVYVWSHRVPVTEPGVLDFEPWSEWGPLKYAEVMFWGVLGCLAYLILTAATYMMRRDFDPWYQSWYLAVFVRAPFITAMLMLIILEFVEWYGEDKSWIHDYILEEGNKYYFIAFMSFCLGLSSDRASSMMRELSNGVSGLVMGAVSKVSSKLRSAVGNPGPAATKH
jgi:hypothetical protein